MIVEHVRFAPPRRLQEYVGQAGHEANGQMLSNVAYDAISAGKNARTDPEYVVVGEYHRQDGARFLELAVTTAHIEANSDFRIHPDSKNLRLLCPRCDTWDGRHTKSCDR